MRHLPSLHNSKKLGFISRLDNARPVEGPSVDARVRSEDVPGPGGEAQVHVRRALGVAQDDRGPGAPGKHPGEDARGGLGEPEIEVLKGKLPARHKTVVVAREGSHQGRQSLGDRGLLAHPPDQVHDALGLAPAVEAGDGSPDGEGALREGHLRLGRNLNGNRSVAKITLVQVLHPVPRPEIGREEHPGPILSVGPPQVSQPLLQLSHQDPGVGDRDVVLGDPLRPALGAGLGGLPLLDLAHLLRADLHNDCSELPALHDLPEQLEEVPDGSPGAKCRRRRRRRRW
mmetsp:Transcript_2748/g.7538  ORF Transcript_2748/g.7538 Transcript_2748/m.7538 type:complete len:286 (+) Transcript_2748:82-939(+)